MSCCIHGLVVYIQWSPQHSEAFTNTVTVMQSLCEESDNFFETDPAMQDSSLQEIINRPEKVEDALPHPERFWFKSQKTAVALIIDVKTCWNST